MLRITTRSMPPPHHQRRHRPGGDPQHPAGLLRGPGGGLGAGGRLPAPAGLARHPLIGAKNGRSLCKNSLVCFRKLWYSRATRQIKAERGGLALPHAPMREKQPPTQQLCCASPHYTGNSPLLQGEVGGFVSDKCGVGLTYPAPLLFVSAVNAPEGAAFCPPRVVPLRKTKRKENE